MFDFFIVPATLINGKPFYLLNGTNNEWSFGYDHINNSTLMAFDIVDDLFLKTGNVRYGHEGNPLYLRAGSAFMKSETLNSLYFSYSPSLIKPFYRATSFDITYTNNFFTGAFYSENVTTGGLFDMSFYFMSPAKSMRILGGHSFIIDTADARNNIGEQNVDSIVPLHFDSVGKFIIFDLPSFGYEMYANTDIMFPFTVNTTTQKLLYNDTFSSSPTAILNFISGSVGQKWRYNNIHFSADLVINSQFTESNLFSPLYTLLRNDYFDSISEWYEKTSAEKSVPDLRYGMRFGLAYRYRESVKYSLYYIPAFTYKNSNIEYYDRLLSDLSVSSTDTKLVQAIFKLILEWRYPYSSVRSGITSGYSEYFKTLLAYTELDLRFAKTFTLGTSACVVPGLINNPELIDFRAEFFIEYDFAPIEKKANVNKTKTIL